MSIVRPYAPSALAFVDGGSDVVNCGSDASVDGFTAFTMAGWYYKKTDTHNSVLWCKEDGFGQKRMQVLNLVTALSHKGIVQRSGYASYSGGAGEFPLNRWTFIAHTYDETDGLRAFVGYLFRPPFESAYSARDVNSGATVDDSAHDLKIGNRNTTAAFPGCIGPVTYIKKRLTLPDITELWKDMAWPVAERRGLWYLGSTVGPVRDLSGFKNHGARTGTTRARGPTPVYPTNADRVIGYVPPVVVPWEAFAEQVRIVTRVR